MTTPRLASLAAACALAAAPSIVSAQSVIAIQLTGTSWASANGVLGNNGSVMNGTTIQPGADYAGPDFRGGAVATNAGITNWHVSNNGGANVLSGLDVFRLQAASFTPSDTASHNAMIFFDQSSFSNGLDASSGGVTLNNTTLLSYTAKRSGGSTTQMGYVIQSDGAFFIHTIAYNDSQAGGGAGHVFTLADPTAVVWSSFSPTVSLSSIGSTATPDFTKVTGMGIWFENQRTTTGALDFRVGEITFNAVSAIPEPSAFTAVAGLGVLGLAAMRRRRRG